MKALLALIFVLSTTAAWALPEAHLDTNSNTLFGSQNYDFEGIVKLSNCSGSLIAFNGQPLTSKAIVMTNGHCVQKPGGYLSAGEVWSNKPLSRKMKIFDHHFELHEVQSTKILYATMTNTDVAFYELTESYQEILEKTGIRPFLLDSSHPVAKTSIDIISGYWDLGYSCEIDDFVYQIREGVWTWSDSIRYTAGCDTIGGTSGSPIILRGERKVIAINNTSNEKGDLCSINNPCEISAEGQLTSRKGLRYGQQTFEVYSCLTPSFTFDLSRKDCALPR